MCTGIHARSFALHGGRRRDGADHYPVRVCRKPRTYSTIHTWTPAACVHCLLPWKAPPIPRLTRCATASSIASSTMAASSWPICRPRPSPNSPRPSPSLPPPFPTRRLVPWRRLLSSSCPPSPRFRSSSGMRRRGGCRRSSGPMPARCRRWSRLSPGVGSFRTLLHF